MRIIAMTIDIVIDLENSWLVASTPLKIWKSIGMVIPNIWKIKAMFQTTNQIGGNKSSNSTIWPMPTPLRSLWCVSCSGSPFQRREIGALRQVLFGSHWWNALYLLIFWGPFLGICIRRIWIAKHQSICFSILAGPMDSEQNVQKGAATLQRVFKRFRLGGSDLCEKQPDN